jgi:hypothetical protein
MDSTLDNQVIKLTCLHCEGSLSERINGLTADPVPNCSPCEAAVQAYADLLRAELARIDHALTDCRGKRDQALWKDWDMLTSQRQ